MDNKIKNDAEKVEGMLNKFSWPQAFANATNRSSIVLLTGFITCMVSLGGFIAGVVEFFLTKNDTIMTQSLGAIVLGVGLLGIHKNLDSRLAGIKVQGNGNDDNSGGALNATTSPQVLTEDKKFS